MTERHPVGCTCVRCCDLDVMRDNPIPRHDREETRGARNAMTEMDRAVACQRHYFGKYTKTCVYCGEQAEI